MFQTEDIELWNLHPNSAVYTSAQKIFNIVGRLKSPGHVDSFHYKLNDGVEREIFLKNNTSSSYRLSHKGDFNVDTINTNQLRKNNTIFFRIVKINGEEKKIKINFPIQENIVNKHFFHLNLKNIRYSHQVGQIVDGKWMICQDNDGESCIEIRKEDSGYDKIILFGHHNWTTGYEIKAKISANPMRPTHNLGILFKWNPHLQGNGSYLSTQWSTGLAYYYSTTPGLRLRFGVNVHFDEAGNKIGDFILKEKPLSTIRWLLSQFFIKVPKIKYPFSQIISNKKYFFRALIHPEKYTLTVWRDDKKEPKPQLVVKNPVERLSSGSVGIIALNCALKIYEFDVFPR